MSWQDIAQSKFAAGYRLQIDRPLKKARWYRSQEDAPGIPYEMALRVADVMADEYGGQIILVGSGSLRNRYPQTIRMNDTMLKIDKIPRRQAENEAGRRQGKWSEIDEHLNRLPKGEALRIPLSDKKELSSLRSYIYQQHKGLFWVRTSKATDGITAFIWHR